MPFGNRAIIFYDVGGDFVRSIANLPFLLQTPIQ
jgi:hypothetical protein